MYMHRLLKKMDLSGKIAFRSITDLRTRCSEKELKLKRLINRVKMNYFRIVPPKKRTGSLQYNKKKKEEDNRSR